MMEETFTKPKKHRNKILIFLFVTVLILFGINIYYALKLHDQNEHLKIEITQSKESLDELNVELESKIQEIESLGGDVSELKKAQEELIKEKEDIRKKSNFTWNQLKEARRIIKGHKELLKQKEKELQKLKVENEYLLTENTELKEDKNVLNSSIQNLHNQKSELEAKVKKAAQLKLKSIGFLAINKKGKVREGATWRKRHVAQVKIAVELDENELASVSSKELILQVFDPEKKVVFDVAKGSGTFTIKGKEQFYSLKQSFIYDKTAQKIDFTFGNFTDFKKGKYLVKVFSGENFLGENNFVIK